MRLFRSKVMSVKVELMKRRTTLFGNGIRLSKLPDNTLSSVVLSMMKDFYLVRVANCRIPECPRVTCFSFTTRLSNGGDRK